MTLEALWKPVGLFLCVLPLIVAFLYKHRYRWLLRWPYRTLYLGDKTIAQGIAIAKRARPQGKPLSEENRVCILIPHEGYSAGQFKAIHAEIRVGGPIDIELDMDDEGFTVEPESEWDCD